MAEVKYETVTESNGDVVTYKIDILHRQEVEDGLAAVSEISQKVDAVVEEIRNLKMNIPESFGTKDELGENTETYIEEIASNLSEGAKGSLSTLTGSLSGEMSAKAYEMDYDEKTEESRVKKQTYTKANNNSNDIATDNDKKDDNSTNNSDNNSTDTPKVRPGARRVEFNQSFYY